MVSEKTAQKWQSLTNIKSPPPPGPPSPQKEKGKRKTNAM
jgi:hypothetical protein